MNHPVRVALIISLLLLFFSGLASAQYMWTDEKGVTHISSSPPTKNAVKAPAQQDEEGETLPEPETKPEPAKSVPAGRTARPDTLQTAPAVTQPAVAAAPPVSQPVRSAQSATAPAAALQTQGVVSSVTTTATTSSTVTTTAITTTTTSATQTAASSTVPQAAQENQNVQAKDAQRPSDMAIMGGIMAIVFGIMFALYLYFSVCLFMIARKLNVTHAWIAFIPIVQILTFLSCAQKPAWWILLFLVPLVNAVIPIYLWMCVSENLGRNKWMGLLVMVPIVNLVYLGMLAFSGGGSSGGETGKKADTEASPAVETGEEIPVGEADAGEEETQIP